MKTLGGYARRFASSKYNKKKDLDHWVSCVIGYVEGFKKGQRLQIQINKRNLKRK